MTISVNDELKQWSYCFICSENKVLDPYYVEKYGEAKTREMQYLICPNHCVKVPEELTTFEHGKYYIGRCRNARIARYNSETDRFIYMRCKFNSVFPESIGHHKNDDGFDLFRAYHTCESPPFEIPLTV
jgi:hypothetical protein